MMTAKQRFHAAIQREKTDRLPVACHFVMPSFLNRYMNGASVDDFFYETGVDPILWAISHTFDPAGDSYFDPLQKEIGFLESRRIASDNWRIYPEPISSRGRPGTRYRFVTPEGSLSMVLEHDMHSSWVTEHLIKEKKDIEIIAKYMTQPLCDVPDVNRQADAYGSRGMVRGWIVCFDIFGQPGTWQDACCLHGVENMIMATYDDPGWAREFLEILNGRKANYIRSLKGARYDIHELGGGDASSTVISPRIFDEFVAPYDSRLISLLHEAGQKVSYHTCGGMMPLLERIAGMGPDAVETLTPPAMGGDADIAEVKRRIGDKVCLIGGFDQYHFLTGCTEAETRKAVRDCFEKAGAGGGYILCTSDNFFDADPNLIKAYADEARKCVYN